VSDRAYLAPAPPQKCHALPFAERNLLILVVREGLEPSTSAL
jgi:hypothetical protein